MGQPVLMGIWYIKGVQLVYLRFEWRVLKWFYSAKHSTKWVKKNIKEIRRK